MTTRYRNVSSDGLSTRSGILPPGGDALSDAFFPDALASWIERGKLAAVLDDASASVPPAAGSLSPAADATDPPRRRARR